MNLNWKYTVLLAIGLILVVQGVATSQLATVNLVFGDSFESGDFSLWTGVRGAPEVTSGNAFRGSYKAVFDASGEDAYKDFTSQTTVFYRFYFQVSVQPEDGTYVRLGEIYAGSSLICFLYYQNDYGTYQLVLRSQRPSTAYSSNNMKLTTNTWYCAEIKFHEGVTDGEYRVWLGGTEIISRTAVNTTGNDASRVRTAQAVATYTVTILYDCVAIADTYIGTTVEDWTPPPPPPPPKGTIVSLDFETGDDSWKIPGELSFEITSPGSYEYSTKYAHSGIYSVKHISPEGSGGGAGRVPIVWVDPVQPRVRTKIFERFYFLVEEWHGFTNFLVFRNPWEPKWMDEAGNTGNGYHILEVSGWESYLRIISHPSAGPHPTNPDYWQKPIWYEEALITVNIERFKWYYLEMGLENLGTPNARGRVWFGEAEKTPTLVFDKMIPGLECYPSIGKTYGGVQLIGHGTAPRIQYTDDLAISNDYIGPLSIVPTPKQPTAAFSWSPKYPYINETVQFDASLSKPNGGTITSYSWTFGDGATSTDEKPTHSYASGDNYTVTLTIEDSEGFSDSASAIVRVLELYEEVPDEESIGTTAILPPHKPETPPFSIVMIIVGSALSLIGIAGMRKRETSG